MSRTRAAIFKTVLIGDGGVGKTSIAVRYTEDRFDQQMKMTIGVNFATKRVEVEGTQMTLMLWDLGGQPRFFDVVNDYFIGSKAAICVYDVTRAYTLDRLDDWISRMRDSAPDAEIFIAGNKTDERMDGFGVSPEEGQAFAEKYNAPFVEMSAKSGEGVHEFFNVVATQLARRL